MAKLFFDKRDLKAITAITLFSLIETSKKEGHIGENDKIIFFTSFGIISAAKIVIGSFDGDEPLTNENYLRFVMQTTLSNTNEILKENKNEDILDYQTSFILEDVTITQGNTTSNVPSMILFAEEIAALSFGDRR